MNVPTQMEGGGYGSGINTKASSVQGLRSLRRFGRLRGLHESKSPPNAC